MTTKRPWPFMARDAPELVEVRLEGGCVPDTVLRIKYLTRIVEVPHLDANGTHIYRYHLTGHADERGRPVYRCNAPPPVISDAA